MKARGEKCCDDSLDHLKEYVKKMSIGAQFKFMLSLERVIEEGGSISVDHKTDSVRYHPPEKVGQA